MHGIPQNDNKFKQSTTYYILFAELCQVGYRNITKRLHFFDLWDFGKTTYMRIICNITINMTRVIIFLVKYHNFNSQFSSIFHLMIIDFNKKSVII
ncbi:MAG TPA: hypothetical protein DDY65_05745 [Ruminococcaceae bacterium]|nr:hypothetical protein [Oscillospiraceae bacterium]